MTDTMTSPGAYLNRFCGPCRAAVGIARNEGGHFTLCASCSKVLSDLDDSDFAPAEHQPPWRWARVWLPYMGNDAPPPADHPSAEYVLLDASGEPVAEGYAGGDDAWIEVASPLARELIRLAPEMEALLRGLRDGYKLNHSDVDDRPCPFCPDARTALWNGKSAEELKAACPALNLLAALDAARK